MAITRETVEEVVPALVYKPGWEFSIDWLSDEEADILIEWDVSDTSYPPNYEAKLNDTHGYKFDTRAFVEFEQCENVMVLCRKILDEAIRLEASSLVHEAREFFRWNLHVEGDHLLPPSVQYLALFHPHKVEGQMLWDETEQGQTYNVRDS